MQAQPDQEKPRPLTSQMPLKPEAIWTALTEDQQIRVQQQLILICHRIAHAQQRETRVSSDEPITTSGVVRGSKISKLMPEEPINR